MELNNLIFPPYFESQEDRQCGRHALNNLYQRNLFTRNILDRVAKDLNMQEIELERLVGDEEDVGRVRNFTESGDYTIQVLMRAVFMVTGGELINLESKEERALKASAVTRNEFGFLVCEGGQGDQSGHWYCLRRIEDTWFKIDSTAMRGPERLRVNGNHIAVLATEKLRKKYRAIYVLVDGGLQATG